MSREVEIIAAINLAGANVKYSKPFLNKIFVSNDECSLKETELSLEADFIERDIAEADNTMLQLVSYTIVINPKARKIFIAQRTSGEERLKNAYCIGFGGHVEVQDYKILKNELPNPILKCAKRELREELRIKNKHLEFNHLGFARALSSPTSEHLGSVYYVTTGSASLKEKDKFSCAKWIDYEEFKQKYYLKLENWSKAIFDYIYETDYYRKLFNFD